MSYSNTDFLRFSAYSIKELITRKLSEDSNFTDQVYEGSNLAVFIDIFSHMAQCLMYSLNSAAAESMFSDTQIYENMSRLVKFIDYHPQGIGLRTMTFTLDNSEGKYYQKVIPRYSFVRTGLYDSVGKPIVYSTVQDQQVNEQEDYDLTLYNGIWRAYKTVFTSSGSSYQKFVCSGLTSVTSGKNQRMVANNMVHVYVKGDPTESQDVVQYVGVTDGVFIDNDIQNGSSIYTSNAKIFDIRLNENKVYEITFGNGYTGKIPAKGSLIYVFYLDTNASHDVIGGNTLRNLKLENSPGDLGVDDDLFRSVVGYDPEELSKQELFKPGSTAYWKNTTPSTAYVQEESVDEIRTNAPQWFKTGNRLVTASDYEYFFKNKNKDLIVDVVCQNNYSYISTFYKWLYALGTNGTLARFGKREQRFVTPSYYLNQNRLIKYDYKWSDAADVNNIYLWIKMRNDSDMLKQTFDDDVEPVKDLTQDPVYLTPLTLNFAVCAETNDTAVEYFTQGGYVFDPMLYNYIELTLDDNCLYSNLDVITRVMTIIQDFFGEDNMRLGQIVDYSRLVTEIYALGNISKIRTVYHNTETGELVIKPGISFATWTSELIDLGDDLDVSTSAKQLEPFQFPVLYDSANIDRHIKIIRKTVNNVNTVSY